VRELVHQGDLGPPGEDRVQVHLFEARPAVFPLGPGDGFQAVQQGLGLRAPVCLSERHHDVGAAVGPAMSLTQQGVGLADARRGPEIYPQVPATRPAPRTPGVSVRDLWAWLIRPAGPDQAVAVSHVRPVSFFAYRASFFLRR
jgi:hypothetical protein